MRSFFKYYLSTIGLFCCTQLFSQYKVPYFSTDTIVVVSGTISDPAGSGYDNKSNDGILVISPAIPGEYIKISFQDLNMHDYGRLYVYDGINTTAPLIGEFSGSAIPQDIYATSVSGSLTLRHSTSSYSGYRGFLMSFECVQEFPLPDLIVTGYLGASYSFINPGQQIYFNPTLKNIGEGISYASSMGLFLSKDTQMDSTDIFLGSQALGSVNSSSSISKEWSNCIIPSDVPGGGYYLMAIADYDKKIKETKENNNVWYATIEVSSPGVDIYPTNISAPSNLFGGNSFWLNYTIQNGGSSSISKVNTGFYLSKDSIFDPSDSLLSTQVITDLLGAKSKNLSVSTPIALDFPVGTYYLILVADNNFTLAETNEKNNVFVSEITIFSNKYFDVFISGATIFRDVYSYPATNKSITIDYYLETISKYSFFLDTLNFYFSTDSAFDASDTKLSYYNYINYVVPKAFNEKTLTLPAGINAGKNFIVLRLDPSNKYLENKENNNLVFLPFTVINPLNELKAEPISVKKIVVPAGNKTAIKYAVSNNGNVAVESGIDYYLSQDSTWDLSDVSLGSKQVNIDLNASISFSDSILIPAVTSPGKYCVLMYVDKGNVLNESDFTNNILPISIDVTPRLTDIAAEYPSFSDSCVVGKSVGLGVYMHNLGTTYSDTSSIGFYLSSDSLYDNTDQLLAKQVVKGIAPEKYSFSYISSTIPMSTLAGDYYLIYRADCYDKIVESNEVNNQTILKIKILPRYVDLTFSNGGIWNMNNSVYAGSVQTMCATLANRGTIPSLSSDMAFYFSTDTILDSLDLLLAAKKGSSIPNTSLGAAGCSFITIPDTASTGTYYILVYADNTQSENEADESNNVGHCALNVVYPPNDLYVQYGKCPSSISIPQVAKVSASVGNKGWGKAVGNVTCILSKDTIPGDTIPGENDIHIGVLDTWYYGVADSNDFYFPSNIPAGNYYMLYCVDYTNLTFESNEKNNLYYTMVVISKAESVEDMSGIRCNVYPNPVSKDLYVSLNTVELATIILYDISGRILFEKVCRGGQEVFSLENFSPGVYELRIYGQEGVFSKKIMKVD